MARDGTYTGGRKWVKGQAPMNPNGRPPLDPEVKKIIVNSRETVARLYWQCVNMSKEELAVRVKENCSVFEEGVLRAIIHDMNKGNITTLEKLMDRVIGKPKEYIQQSVDVSSYQTVDISNEELFAKAKLIMERNQNEDSGRSIEGSQAGEIENRMGEDGDSTGGNIHTARLVDRARVVNEAEDGEDQ